MQKNQTVLLTCENLGADMEGVCRMDGMAVFVKGMLPGETGRVIITKIQKAFAFGRLLSLESTSGERQDPPCRFFKRCGGCSCQHMRYETTLRSKRRKISDCFERIGGITLDVPPVLGMADPFHYRNKTSLPVGGTAGDIHMGFFAPRSHEIIPIDACLIAMEPSNLLQTALHDWMRANRIVPYNEETHTGLVRHLVTRVNQKGEAMAVIVINGPALPQADALAQALLCALPGLKSLYVSVNDKRTNVILGEKFTLLYGEETLCDILCGLTFELSPQSFFQVNPIQTEVLYRTALDFADLSGSETVADLYCGAGTISLLLAGRAKKVLGIESVAPAVLNAQENALRNNIQNAEFITGTAESGLPKLVAEGYRPDVITLDPPRKGVEPEVIDAVAKAAPKRVVYVSCDVATQARDAKLFLEKGYHVTRSQGVDMFAWTSGVENVILLQPQSPS